MKTNTAPILVTGASGLLGRAIYRELCDTGRVVRGTAFQRARSGLDRVDLCDAGALRAYLAAVRPGCIIHSAAERKPDLCEGDPERIQRLNVESTAILAAHARTHGCLLIYLSTDYVFDGTKPPYQPGDAPNPVNAYGRSKLAGEEAVRAQLADAVVLRVPILYGPVETLAESPVTVVAADLLAAPDTTLRLDHWAIRYPTHVGDVAYVCRQILAQRAAGAGPRGILHWAGDEPMTKYEMGEMIADLLGCSRDRLVAVPHTIGSAPRPHDCHLDCTATEALGIGHRTPIRAALREILAGYR